MREKVAKRWGMGICVFAASVSALASRRAEPNAFLATKADSVAQLLQEIRADREVAGRYARHFGKTRSQLLTYFASLHLAKLNEDGIYTVYGVDPKGAIKSHAQKLKAGTKVFSDPLSVPILLAGGGNAMVSGCNAQILFITPNDRRADRHLTRLGGFLS